MPLRRIVAVTSLLAAWIFVAGSARAGTRRVALLDSDAELLHAVSIALSPWAIEVIMPDAAAPSASPPQAVTRAGELARQLEVNALVWVSIASGESVVWMYDADTGKVSSRAQPAILPFDAPAAAAVALSLKTLLRATDLAPEPERLRASWAGTSWLAPVRLEVGGGVRAFANHALTPYFEVGAAFWWEEGGPGAWGIALRGALTTGAGVETDSLSASVRETAVSAAVRRFVRVGEIVAIVPSVGSGLHVSTLEGALVGGGSAVSDTRANASLDVGLAFPIRLLGQVDAGFYLSGSYLLRHQRYLVGARTGFEAWPYFAEFGAQVATTLF
jgi:hypothetical protein